MQVRERRTDLGLSQARLAELANTTQQTIDRIERGETLHSRALPKILAILDIDLQPRANQLIFECPLVGYVGAGAEAHFHAMADDPAETVTAPEGATPHTVAVEVRGESLGAVFDRWLVFYDQVHKPVSQELHGRLCVIGLADDRVLVKQLKPSRTAGLYHLLSNTEPPILDVAVAWAAPIKAMKPR